MLSPTPDDDYDEVDMAALKRAMTIAARDPGMAAHFKSKLEDAPWGEVAEDAAAHCQIRALNLPPWSPPPSRASWMQGGKVHRNPDAAALCDALLDAGLSEFEPDPKAALAKANRRR